MTTAAFDLSDVLRAQIVFTVSAMDQFIHEMVRLGVVDVARGIRLKTDAYLRLRLPTAAVHSALDGLPHETWMGETVREMHSWQSFQDPDKIADAVRLISSVVLWQAVADELGAPPQDIKTRLRLIVERRNKIAHEADMDPSNPGFRWPIGPLMVTDTIDFVERLGRAIYRVVV